MLITVPDVLNKEELAVVSDYMASASFVDGKLSAGSEAGVVKNNLEMRAADQHMAQLNNLVMGRLVKHPVYLNAALPAKIAAPFYAKYSRGMQYGSHIDDPIMGPAGQRYCTDLSITCS